MATQAEDLDDDTVLALAAHFAAPVICRHSERLPETSAPEGKADEIRAEADTKFLMSGFGG